MAEERKLEPVRQQDGPSGKKKPDFNGPFLKAGLFLGIVGGLPFVNLLNMLFFLWALIAGIIAAKLLSKQFKYMQPVHGAVAGVFTGGLGAVISSVMCGGFAFGVYHLAGPEVWAYVYPPGILPDFVHNMLLSLYPFDVADRLFIDMTEEAVKSDILITMVINLLTLEVGYWIMGGVGGFIGGVLYGTPPPKKTYQRPPSRKKATSQKPAPSPAPGPRKVKAVYAKPVQKKQEEQDLEFEHEPGEEDMEFEEEEE